MRRFGKFDQFSRRPVPLRDGDRAFQQEGAVAPPENLLGRTSPQRDGTGPGAQWHLGLSWELKNRHATQVYLTQKWKSRRRRGTTRAAPRGRHVGGIAAAFESGRDRWPASSNRPATREFCRAGVVIGRLNN